MTTNNYVWEKDLSLNDLVLKQKEEIERLNNIINELEKEIDRLLERQYESERFAKEKKKEKLEQQLKDLEKVD